MNRPEAVARLAGRFIVIEGGEGAGKSTQLARLAERLRGWGLAVETTREPGGTPGAEMIRRVLLDPASGFSATTEALLFAAARSDHVEKRIRPALERGSVVLCDRFTASTRAYQGALDGTVLDALDGIATRGLEPDLIVLLDVPPEEGLRRAARRRAGTVDRFEGEPLAVHTRIRARFLDMAAADPARWLVLDATAPEAEVAARVAAGVVARLVGAAA